MPDSTTFGIPDDVVTKACEYLPMEHGINLHDVRSALAAVKLDLVRAYFTPQEIGLLKRRIAGMNRYDTPDALTAWKKLEELRYD